MITWPRLLSGQGAMRHHLDGELDATADSRCHHQGCTRGPREGSTENRPSIIREQAHSFEIAPHISIHINKHARRRELLYDIIHQERLDEDLENLEVAITHTNDDDNPIPITFDLTLMLLAHHINNMYSRTIYEWIKSHPILIVDRRNPSAIEPPFGTECIRIGWTGSGVDIWS